MAPIPLSLTLTGTATGPELQIPAPFTGTIQTVLDLAAVIAPPSTAANVLRGTWLPFVADDNPDPQGRVYQYQTGHSLKIGPMVWLWAYTQFSAKGNLAGPLSLKNFPYQTSRQPGFFAGVCAYFSNLEPSAAITGVTIYSGGTQREAMINCVDQGKYMNPRRLLGSELNDHSQFVMAISYPTDD